MSSDGGHVVDLDEDVGPVDEDGGRTVGQVDGGLALVVGEVDLALAFTVAQACQAQGDLRGPGGIGGLGGAEDQLLGLGLLGLAPTGHEGRRHHQEREAEPQPTSPARSAHVSPPPIACHGTYHCP